METTLCAVRSIWTEPDRLTRVAEIILPRPRWNQAGSNAELPNLVELDVLRFHVVDTGIMKLRTGCAGSYQQSSNSVDRNILDPAD